MDKGFLKSLPAELVSHVRAGCGDNGGQWLTDLPSMLETLESEWELKLEAPFPGIEYNFVAPARRVGGESVVVKIAPPWEPVEIFGEAAYLRHRDGNGCVRLLAEKQSLRAILIERIFPGEALFSHFAGRADECVAPAIQALQKVLMPVPVEVEHVVALDKWYAGLRRYLETAFPHAYAARALEIYDRLSKQPEKTFYLHGDYHPGNVVTRGESDFWVIDPKGVSGHIGFEIATFLNNLHWWQEKRADLHAFLDRAIAQFSEAFEIDPFELREWAFSQRVIGAWWNFVDMPELYDGRVVSANVWEV